MAEQVEKGPRGQISSNVRESSSLRLDLSGGGLEVFLGRLGAKIVEVVGELYKAKNYFVEMKEIMDRLEIEVGEELPSRTAVLNRIIELGEMNVLFVQEVIGHGGKKIQVGPNGEKKTLFEELTDETIERLNQELELLGSEFSIENTRRDNDTRI